MLEARLRGALEALSSSFSGRLSLSLLRFEDNFRFSLDGQRPQLAASLIKLPILAAALKHVQEGRLRLEARYPLDDEDKAGGNGVLKSLGAGIKLSLGDLLTLMIIVSDNTATNMVIDLTGADEVNRFCEAAGLAKTKLAGKLQLPVSLQNEAQRAGARNKTCPDDVLTLLAALYRGSLLRADLNDFALSTLKRQLYTEALARYLPVDPRLHQSPVTVASKSGCLPGLWHDAGIVFAQHDSRHDAHRDDYDYALVVMTEGSSDLAESWEQEGLMLIANVSKAVFELIGWRG